MAVFVLRHSAEASYFVAPFNTFRVALRGIAGVFLACVVILTSLGVSGAVAQEWIVKRVSGIAYFVAPGVEAFRVKPGMVFEKGYTIGTQPGARALIARGSETISVGPDTTFAISKYRSQGIKTTLLQRKGSIEVDVKKRKRPHFTVETPFLAAVVKGTKFNVSVSDERAKVSVQRGVVGVEDFASGDTANLRAGQRASTAPARKVGLSVGGKTKPDVKHGNKRAPVFQTPPVKNVPAKEAAAARTRAGKTNSGRGFFGGSSGGHGNGNGNGNGNSSNSGGGHGNSGGHGNGNSSNSGHGHGNGNSGNHGNGGGHGKN